MPKRLNLRTRDFEEHGATRACKGCIAMARGRHQNPSHGGVSKENDGGNGGDRRGSCAGQGGGGEDQ